MCVTFRCAIDIHNCFAHGRFQFQCLVILATGRTTGTGTPAPDARAERDEAASGSPPLIGDGPDGARVRAALEKAKWRREQAAEILGVSPRTLYRWIKKLGL